VAERFKALVLKTSRGRELPREFESHPFRHLLLILLLYFTACISNPCHYPCHMSAQARRAALLRHRADQLKDLAQREPRVDHACWLLEQAKVFAQAVDALAPPEASASEPAPARLRPGPLRRRYNPNLDALP
jgi:hypothetical protein